MDLEIKDILMKIIEEQGLDIVLQEKIFLSVLADYAPNLSKERKLIKLAYMEQIVSGLYSDIYQKKENNYTLLVSRYSQRLQENTAMNQETANQLVTVICSVISRQEISYASREIGNPLIDLYSLCVLAQKGDKDALTIFDDRFTIVDKDIRAKAYEFITMENVANGTYQISYDLEKNGYAYVLIGDMYLDGNGTEVNEEKAIRYYKKAAELGNPYGEVEYGYMLYYGKGVPTNQEEGFHWYEKAAKHGDVDGESAMGWFYANGKFVEKNANMAFMWYEKAASHGYGTQLVELGNCYYGGFGADKNLEKAFQLYEEAAKKNNAVGQRYVGYMYYYGEGVTKSNLKAFEYFGQAAEQDDSYAQYYVGCMYKRAIVTKQMEAVLAQDEQYYYKSDEEKGRYWLEKAANQGVAEANYVLAAAYFIGKEVAIDLDLAEEYAKKAIEINQPYAYMDAQVLLGEIYEDKGLIEKASKLYEDAARENHPRGIYKMGDVAFSKQQYREALSWYQKAATYDLPEACGKLADMYKNGKGVMRNIILEKRWREKELDLLQKYKNVDKK